MSATTTFVGGGHAGDFSNAKKNRRHGRLPQVLLLLVASFSVHADYQTGLNAYSHGDYTTAMQEWTAVTEQPPTAVNPYIYAETHYAISRLYWQGQGVSRDYYKAREWLEKAAALSHAGAMAKLGYLYTDGISVTQDFEQAFEWYSKAAKLGDVDGQYNLGIFYLNGWGVEQDRTMAKQYLAAASAQGDPEAEQALQQLLASDDHVGAGHARDSENLNTELEPKPVDDIETALAEDINVAQASEPVVGGGHARDLDDANKITNTNNLETPEPESVPSLTDSPSVDPLPNRGHGPLLQQETPAKEPEVISESFTFQTEPWIESRNPDHYTIQVIGLRDIEDLKALVTGHESHTPWAIYTLQRNQAPLYILIQGEYETVEAARAAKANFPFRVSRRDETWIRRFEMIQKAIEGDTQ